MTCSTVPLSAAGCGSRWQVRHWLGRGRCLGRPAVRLADVDFGGMGAEPGFGATAAIVTCPSLAGGGMLDTASAADASCLA